MSEAVYQENILALAAREDGGGVLPAPTASVKKSNPLCGDEILLTAQIDGGRIIALAHRTRGCLLCRAAAARFWLWREETKPDSRALLDFAARAQKMFSRNATTATAAENGDATIVEELQMFAPVVAHPSRHGCVLLPFWAAADLAASLAPADCQSKNQ